MAERKRYRRWSRSFWVMVIFLFLGYVPTIMTRDPKVSMVLAVAAVIPFAASAKTFRIALWRGFALGLLAGLAMNTALIETHADLPPQVLNQRTAVYIGATVFACTVVALLFFYTAQQRRKRAEDSWR